MFAVPREQLLRIHASSGTTGKPTVVGYTASDLDALVRPDGAVAGLGRARRPGDIVHNAYGYGLFTGGLGAHYGAERLGATVVPVSGGGTERQVQLLRTSGATCCARRRPTRSTSPKSPRTWASICARLALRIGLFGAEPWSEAMRRDLEARLGIKAIDVYGLSEIIGPGRRLRMPVDAERPARLGGSLPVRDDRSGDAAAAADGRDRRIGDHDAHQGSAADDPLSHPRHHAAVDEPCACGRTHRAHHAGHGPRRRHADHPRRQRLSVAGRSRCWSASPASRRTTSWC